MKLEQNDKTLLFSETTIPDVFFSDYLSQIPGDYVKIYLYIIFLSKYNKDVKVNEVSTEEYLKITNTKQAYRPRNSKLSKEKLINMGFTMLPSYKDALKRYKEELDNTK